MRFLRQPTESKGFANINEWYFSRTGQYLFKELEEKIREKEQHEKEKEEQEKIVEQQKKDVKITNNQTTKPSSLTQQPLEKKEGV